MEGNSKNVASSSSSSSSASSSANSTLTNSTSHGTDSKHEEEQQKQELENNIIETKSTNWLMSLSRRRKNQSNKENNNQKVNKQTTTTIVTTDTATTTTTTAVATTTTTTTIDSITQPNNFNDELAASPIVECCTNNDSTRNSNSLNKKSTKNNSTNILYVLSKCLKLKSRTNSNFLSIIHRPVISSQNDNVESTSSALTTTLPSQPQQSSIPPHLPTSSATATTIDAQAQSSQPRELVGTGDVLQQLQSASDSLMEQFIETKTIQQTNWWQNLEPIERIMYQAKIDMNPYGWYRGSMSRQVAQKKLQGQSMGSFLVRDSQTKGLFTLSFRSAGITLHCRIDNSDGYWIIESRRFTSMVTLIEHARELSRNQIFCYVKPSSQLQQPFPVRLTNPISKFDEVPSLQHICRFIIRNKIDDAKKLDCLPVQLQEYVNQNLYLGTNVGYFEI